MTKGKVAKIEEEGVSGDPIVTVEDVLGGGKIKKQFDMVVLAAGMEPAAKSSRIPANIAYEANGFMDGDNMPAGMYAVGVARRPDDVATSVQDATSSAIRSIQSIKGAQATAAAQMAGGN